MAHYAKVVNGIVDEVIVAEQEYIDSLPDALNWIQTSYNTYNGVHKNGKTPLRGNFAAQGYIYDKQNDVFYPPKPFESWTLNTNLWEWESPTPYPQDGKTYKWNESNLSWNELE